ncbi:hypothetical protein BJY01DRAFT_224763 [Aspergillus pseudoustus]|uniref:F-box domain-containing protein n=1 Tax=Aspergillus pseudoustus TaxID=1810923 RepID=A0ABR4J243_9EURO
MDTQNGLLAILAVHECAAEVLACLPRADLKSLRLTCKEMDELATSSVSPLFRRAYISAFRHDLEVLQAIAVHPRLSRCVRELVWDSTLQPRREQYYDESVAQDDASAYILDGYSRNLNQGKDFELLLDVLPRFPRLQGVILTVLMSYWIPQQHGRNRVYLPVAEVRTELSSLESPKYSSPAMRAWENRRLDYVLKHHQFPRAGPRDIPDDEVLLRLERHAAHQPDAEPMDFTVLATSSHRAPILMLAALRARNIRLASFVIDVPAVEKRHRTVSKSDLRGIYLQIIPGRPLTLGMTWFVDIFHSVRRLRLSLGTVDGRFQSALEGATGLEILELTLHQMGWMDLSKLLPALRLKRLTLQNFELEKRQVETILIPWCFEVGLQTLQLAECRFFRVEGMTETELFIEFVNKDTSIPLSASEDVPLPAPEDAYYFDSDSHYDSEVEEPSAAAFLGLDFDSDLDSDSDPEFFPSTPEMLSRHSDAPFCDDSYPEFVDEMAKVYWLYYHEESEEEFEEHSDTASISDEVPMPRLKVDQARLLDIVTGERVELVYEAATWGYRGSSLRVWIDEFKVHTQVFQGAGSA